MTNSFLPATTRRVLSSALFALAALPALAAAPQQRILTQIDNSDRVTLTGSRTPRAEGAVDLGAVPADTALNGITLVFTPTAAQQADLDTLMAAQQNPSSPLYHQWLTPAQFGVRFGLSESDLALAQAWIQQQGFTLDSISTSRTRITFSGTEAQVEAAFGAPLHYYRSVSGEQRYAPAADLSLPAALAAAGASVTHLSSFRTHPHVIFKAPQPAPTPDFTSSQTGSHFTTPADVDTIYDVTAAYNAGYTGAGQTIAIVGQSAIVATDISNFQTAAGITSAHTPTQLLVPNSGTSTVYSGDEAESDLDLEYSSTIAKGAAIDFIYTGNNPNYGVFDSLQYAVDSQIAPIISISYGICEPLLGATEFTQLDAIMQQASVQGQTIIASAGDDGSTACSGQSNVAATEEALSVSYPASSAYVTALGGTEFLSADVASTATTYWTAASGTDVIGSAKSYIPEQTWNDDTASSGLSSGGGGISLYAARPSWQTGVPGITTGSFRLVPDISLDSSPNNAGYLYCSSDSLSTGITGSCSNGFRDSNDQYLTVAGGTSFAAPIFAGMLGVINQAKGYTSTHGQGVIGTTLYTLAANASTYAAAFHDITLAGNQCLGGTTYCGTGTDTTSYAAATGYDLATGLGSIDLDLLLTAWPATTSTGSNLASTNTSISAASTTPALNASDLLTITVAPNVSSSIKPTGTVSLNIGGTVVNPALPLTNGVATYTFSSATAASEIITATYSGDSVYSSSIGTININVGATAFTIAAPNLTITSGSSATQTITITPVNGYSGTVALTISGGVGLSNTCVIGPQYVTVNGAVTTATLTYYTSAATCTANGAGTGTTNIPLKRFPITTTTSALNHPLPANNPWRKAPLPVAALAGVLLFGSFRRRSQLLRGVLALAFITALSLSGLSLSGCTGSVTANSTNGGGTTSSGNAPTGTYSVTLTGSDTINSTITASTNFTITIQ
jgi:hypothetical protein